MLWPWRWCKSRGGDGKRISMVLKSWKGGWRIEWQRKVRITELEIGRTEDVRWGDNCQEEDQKWQISVGREEGEKAGKGRVGPESATKKWNTKAKVFDSREEMSKMEWVTSAEDNITHTYKIRSLVEGRNTFYFSVLLARQLCQPLSTALLCFPKLTAASLPPWGTVVGMDLGNKHLTSGEHDVVVSSLPSDRRASRSESATVILLIKYHPK